MNTIREHVYKDCALTTQLKGMGIRKVDAERAVIKFVFLRHPTLVYNDWEENLGRGAGSNQSR